MYMFSNDFVNTYATAVLSSGFDRVSVVAIEKHPTAEERSGGGGRKETR